MKIIIFWTQNIFSFLKHVKLAGNDTLPLYIPKTDVFIDNGNHQLRTRDLLFFARGVPTISMKKNILSFHIQLVGIHV